MHLYGQGLSIVSSNGDINFNKIISLIRISLCVRPCIHYRLTDIRHSIYPLPARISK